VRRLLTLLATCGLLGVSAVVAGSAAPALVGSIAVQSSASPSTLADGAAIPVPPFGPGKWMVENLGPTPIQAPAPVQLPSA
jgi:hypothetical protein